MSLSREYLNKRHEEHTRLGKLGYISLGTLARENNIKIYHLMHSNLLKIKEIVASTDLLDYELTDEGKEIFESPGW